MMRTQDKKYDLEERTTMFSENTIKLCQKCPRSPVIDPVINQLVRSATSIGANYAEANGAASKKDFKNKIQICKKESKETQYWLRVLADALDDDNFKVLLRPLWQEAKELTLIFAKISLNTK